jgi:hypothetical protein
MNAEHAPERRRRWAVMLSAAAALGAVVPTGTASAAAGTVELGSGVEVGGNLDLRTEISLDGGATFAPALVFPRADPAYAVIPGTAWVSTERLGFPTLVPETLFRATFTVPEDDRYAGTATICVHADNAASIELNGQLVGEQPLEADPANFQGPPECFTYTGPLPGGENVLLFTVHNYGAGMGLDYHAQIDYAPIANQPPVLELPADVTAEATGPSGAAVTYQATATDPDGAEPAVSCAPASGNTFPLGRTAVTCTATDDDGATVSGEFTVTVTDTTAPTLGELPDRTATAGPAGTATVTWTATATDAVDPGPVVGCDPPAGAAFPVGRTTVTCTATDASGNTASGSFVVTVAPARDVMDRLGDAIRAADVGPLVRAVLLIGHGVADIQLDAGRIRAGCGLLQALDLGIRASGRTIPPADAATLRALVAEARSTYGC